jgi:hypothetical protein
MGLREWLGLGGGTPEAVSPVRIEGYAFARAWTCGTCQQQMRIRVRQDRAEGPSNYETYPPRHPKHGHSVRPSGDLNWNGLAEERGWTTNPVCCPTCK